MSDVTQTGLSQAQVEHFIEHGYLKLEGAFDGELARQGRERLWALMGLSQNAPETWKQPVVRLGFQTGKPFVEAANTPLLHASYDALVGEDRWLRPNGLGTFPVRFPSPNDPGDVGWHVDVSFGTDNADFMQWASSGSHFTVASYDRAHPSGKCFSGWVQHEPAILANSLGLR